MAEIHNIIENYKSLCNDISKIERKTAFLKNKKKELEDEIIGYYQNNGIETMNHLTIMSNIRREPLSKKYLERIIEEYYKKYYVTNKVKFGGGLSDMSEFSKKKTEKLLEFILSNRSSKKYFRLHIE